MKVVIDTSVVVSAAFRDRIPEEIILFIVRSLDFEWIASPDILTEYVEVLGRPKFGLAPSVVREWESLLRVFVTLVAVPPDISFVRDQKDAKFLTCAVAANADYLITSDSDFVEAQSLLKTVICSVSQFKSLFVDKST